MSNNNVEKRINHFVFLKNYRVLFIIHVLCSKEVINVGLMGKKRYQARKAKCGGAAISDLGRFLKD